MSERAGVWLASAFMAACLVVLNLSMTAPPQPHTVNLTRAAVAAQWDIPSDAWEHPLPQFANPGACNVHCVVVTGPCLAPDSCKP